MRSVKPLRVAQGHCELDRHAGDGGLEHEVAIDHALRLADGSAWLHVDAIDEQVEPIARSDLPTELDAIMSKILAKKPEDRYQNGRAMALALRDCSNRLES